MLDLPVAVALSLAPGRARFAAATRLRDRWPGVVSPGCDTRCPPLDTLIEDLLPRCADPVALARDLADRAEQVILDAAAAGVGAVVFGRPGYPPRLAAIPDPPLVLWWHGADDVPCDGPAVAIVGSRAATSTAAAAARSIAADLAASRVLVVSGLARGVDAAAHEGALSAGRTIAVLGSGVRVIYPSEHAHLAERVRRAGALVSEFPPRTAPQAHHFPLRNRIISGLSLAVVVVEAGETSGALITARTALEQGRDVMAVPGQVLSGRNRGAHALIKDGAALVESADDVLAALGLHAARGTRSEDEGNADDLLALIPIGEPVDADQLAARSGRTVTELLARLTGLELAGRVERLAGGRFFRAAGKMVR